MHRHVCRSPFRSFWKYCLYALVSVDYGSYGTMIVDARCALCASLCQQLCSCARICKYPLFFRSLHHRSRQRHLHTKSLWPSSKVEWFVIDVAFPLRKKRSYAFVWVLGTCTEVVNLDIWSGTTATLRVDDLFLVIDCPIRPSVNHLLAWRSGLALKFNLCKVM